MERKLIVNTAQSWYEAAHDGSYVMGERLFYMENALNHTENMLAAAIEVIRYSRMYTTNNEIEKFLDRLDKTDV
jgi:hypothetical protein